MHCNDRELLARKSSRLRVIHDITEVRPNSKHKWIAETSSILIQAYVTGQECEVNPKKSARGNVEHEEAFWNFTLVKTRKGDLTLILSFYTETSIKFYWNFDLAHSKPMSQSKTKVESLIWISPWRKKPWHQKGGSQLDSELSGGPWALKMEILTECTVCAILKMSSDNSSFESGVGILWLMCTWAFQVLYSRAWQTSVATWPDVRDIWMFIWVEWDVYLSRIISIESYKIQPSGDWTKSQISNCSYSVVILSL